MIRPPPAAGAMLICFVALDAVAPQAEEYKWWRDPTAQQDLRLTAVQVKTLERVLASTEASIASQTERDSDAYAVQDVPHPVS